MFFKVYTRLNHLNVTLSYNATLVSVTEVSKLHKTPLQAWIAEGHTFKFVGDNLDKKKRVRDMRRDHQSEMQHMYSILAVRSRVPFSSSCETRKDFVSLEPSAFLPTPQDVKAIQANLVVLVGTVICKNIKHLSFLSKVIPTHITHRFSKKMSEKSEYVVLDVLMKNEAKNTDMLDIMKTMQGYLGEGFPYDKKVLSGGDLLTCERQIGAKRHVMDSDTPHDRLEEFEVQSEDWHALMSFLGVRKQHCVLYLYCL